MGDEISKVNKIRNGVRKIICRCGNVVELVWCGVVCLM